MDLVDHQDDIPLLSDLFNQALHPALKLSAELRPRHQRGQIQQENLLVLELIGHIPHGNPLGQALGDRRLADTGFADEAGVVLLPAVQNLDHAFEFFLSADHGVQLSGAGAGSQINAVVVQIFPLSVFRIGSRIGPGALRTGAGAPARVAVGRIPVCPGSAAVGPEGIEELSEEGEGRGLAVFVILRSLLRVHPHELFHTAHGVHHLTGQIIQIFIGDPHLGQNVVHGFDVQFPGTFQAKAFTLRLISFNLCDKYNRRILSAAGADTCLHRYLSVKNCSVNYSIKCPCVSERTVFDHSSPFVRKRKVRKKRASSVLSSVSLPITSPRKLSSQQSRTQ